jgi:hypothetical protein
MPPMRKSVSTSTEGEAEASRLRALLGRAFAAPAAEIDAEPEVVSELGDEAGEAAPEHPTERQDWSVTLDNVGRMTALLREHGARLAAAEARAQAAEARAAEAETWLRRLHQAVLDGLPTAKRA